MEIRAKYAGIDGCRAGWIVVVLHSDGSWQTELYSTIRSIWEQHHDAECLLLDMPIGLVSGKSGLAARRCDVEARQFLKPYRASSIFAAPIREVLEAETYVEANALSRNLTGKGLSKQSWNLVPKIRDVDTFMRTSVGKAGSRIIESHPELCMAALFGGPLHHNKKTLQGYEERLHRLSGLYPDAEGVVHEALGRFRRQDMARDDIVDALALAVTAWTCEGRLTEVPAQPQHDSCGLPMRIVFYPRQERHLP